MRVAPGGLSANDLSLHLSGSFTNLGSFGVSRNLFIDAAGGIDNSGAALRAGGRMQLFGAGLNNQAGTLQAGSLYAAIDGDILTQDGRVVTEGGAWLDASGAIQAHNASLSSRGGNFILSAGGTIELSGASLRAASGAVGVIAGGKLALDDALVDGNSVDLRADGSIHGNALTISSRGNTTLTAGENLQIGAQAVHASSGAGASVTATDSWRGSSITAKDGNVSASAAGLLDIKGSDLAAGGTLRLSGQQVRIEALQERSQSRSEEDTGGERVIGQNQTLVSTGGLLQGAAGVNIVASAPAAGKDAITARAGELSLQGARIESGASVTLSGANVTLSANTDRASSEFLRSGHNQFLHTTQARESLAGGSVRAAGDISVIAGGLSPGSGNIALAGAQLSAQGAVGLLANGDIDLAAVLIQSSASQDSWRKQSGWFSTSTTKERSSSEDSTAQVSTLSGNSVTVLAGNNALLEGTRISAQHDALVYAGNQLSASAAHDSASQSASGETKSTGRHLSLGLVGAQYGTRGGGNASTSATSTARGVEISSAQGNASLYGANLAVVEGASLSAAQGKASITGGSVIVLAGVNTSSTSSTSADEGAKINALGLHKLTEGLNHKAQSATGIDQTSLAYTTLTGQNVSIIATDGDAHIAGARVTTPGVLTLGASNTLFLDGQQTQKVTSLQSQGRDLMYQKLQGSGSQTQSTEYNQFSNAAKLQVNAPKISAQIGSQDSAQQLAQQPGMAWVGQLLSDPALQGKVNWTALQDASRSWDYKQQGLTPEGAVIVTIVVAYFTAGAAGAAGEALAAGAGFTGTSAAVVAGATTAGLTTLASRAAVATLNHPTDPGAALKELGSSANVRAVVGALLTGGVLAGLDLNPTGSPTAGGGAQPFLTQLGQNLKAGVAKALMNTAVNGGGLEDNLKTAITSASID